MPTNLFSAFCFTGSYAMGMAQFLEQQKVNRFVHNDWVYLG